MSVARPVVSGLIASGLLLALYLAVLSLVSGWEPALTQFGEFWPWVIALAAGFGTQVGLYVRLRRVVSHRNGSGQVVAVSGGTSTAAMISCCTHYLANLVPLLGATGVVALVAEYQTALLWVGLAFNAAGVAYIGRKLLQASRHMARMEEV